MAVQSEGGDHARHTQDDRLSPVSPRVLGSHHISPWLIGALLVAVNLLVYCG